MSPSAALAARTSIQACAGGLSTPEIHVREDSLPPIKSPVRFAVVQMLTLSVGAVSVTVAPCLEPTG